MDKENFVTKHEWRRSDFVFKKCKHCKCSRSLDRDGDFIYKPQGANQWQLEVPKCIAREIKRMKKEDFERIRNTPNEAIHYNHKNCDVYEHIDGVYTCALNECWINAIFDSFESAIMGLQNQDLAEKLYKDLPDILNEDGENIKRLSCSDFKLNR